MIDIELKRKAPFRVVLESSGCTGHSHRFYEGYRHFAERTRIIMVWSVRLTRTLKYLDPIS